MKKVFLAKTVVLAGFILGSAVLLSGCEAKKSDSPLGETVKYSNGEEGKQYMGKGWSNLESEGAWTDGKEASLHFNIPGEHNLVMDVQYYPFVTSNHAAVNVAVLVNGKKQADWTLVEKSEANPHRIILGSAPDGNYVVTFKILNPTSPKSQGMSDDTRALGIYLEKTKIHEAENQ